MQLSRGTRRLLTELKSYARHSGRAFPFQETLATRLGVDVRTIKRWVRELREAGQITVRRRQHSSAEYEIQKGQNVPSNVPSGAENVLSGAPYLYMSSNLELRGVRPATKKPPQSEDQFVDWMEVARQMVEARNGR